MCCKGCTAARCRTVGAATEGTETRFGVFNSATFASATTLTSTGSVDSFHDSYTALGGGVAMLNMMLGEVAPGGTGSGLYGMLILAVITVFGAGLMVGRTPEYLGKKIGAREIKFASLYFLVTPTLVLLGTAVAMATDWGKAGMANPGAHGLSEVLYAFTSASNNNGSAFAGLSVSGTEYNTALGLCMLLGRLLPIIFALGLARLSGPPDAGAGVQRHAEDPSAAVRYRAGDGPFQPAAPAHRTGHGLPIPAMNTIAATVGDRPAQDTIAGRDSTTTKPRGAQARRTPDAHRARFLLHGKAGGRPCAATSAGTGSHSLRRSSHRSPSPRP
jgi:hypothetical protein